MASDGRASLAKDLKASSSRGSTHPTSQANFLHQTERSHEENQERAYIAASRRTDRSLEARIQSAHMASEVHRRRTGRDLKVTEKIVLKEEIYEEEDDLPCHNNYLTSHLRTKPSVMDHQAVTHITTQTSMATMIKYNKASRLFSESFPAADTYLQQLDQCRYIRPLIRNSNFQSLPTSPLEITSSACFIGQFGDLDRHVPSTSGAAVSTIQDIAIPAP